ncbi:MAG: 16S rRNA (adenine(1518)-N(6)/adenine(1519)-N(6))-dimethyltransferase RsmA [Gammaproteobacteria bacterium]|nr:16S rRNA (adenine(1518)-N(6)/adenine(1519)-N(6))-dimethyltransferase RsmA [Gammaproteobacteria bacterium]
MGHTARKRFGQHFLCDTQVIQHLVDVIDPIKQQHIVEIGPGRGALTIPVLKKIGVMDVVELDRDLIPYITARCKDIGVLNVYQADALEFDFAKLITDEKPLRVIGNLPYNISTPLIFHLLEYTTQIEDMHFMLQKEVVDRMAAKIGNSDYGRLSIMVQYHCQVTALFDVPPTAFDPPPKVDSKIVKLVPYTTIPFPAKNYSHFANIVKHAFNQRRKTLRNCLKHFMQDEDWQKVNIDSKLRPEQLTVEQYIHISNSLQN